MATFYSGYSRNYRLRLELTESNINIENNTSAVNWALYLEFGNRSFAGSTDSGSGYIDGVNVWTPASSYNFRGVYNTSRLLGSGAKTVAHASDGTGSASYSFSFSANSGGYGPVGLSVSGTLGLSTIPRATQPTLSSPSANLGESVTIGTPRYSSSFTHKLYYKVGSDSLVYIAGGIETSYNWTVPKALANKFPNAISGDVIIYCYTYSGTTQIGSYKTVTLKANIPGTGEFSPTIVSVDTEEAAQSVIDNFNGKWVQGLSQVKVNISAQGAYGSSITNYATTIDTVDYSESEFTSNILTNGGVIPIKVIITDSRGRKATYNESISVTPYNKPTLSNIQYHINSNSIDVDISGKVSSVDGMNTKSLVLKYKSATETQWHEQSVTIAEWNFNVTTTIIGVANDETYDLLAVLTDKIASAEMSTQTGVVTMSMYAGGKGVTFFGEAEEPGFIVKSATMRVKPNVPNVGETKILHDNNGTDTDYGSYFMDTEDNTYNNYSSIRIYRKKALQDQISMVTRKNGGTREAYNILGEHNTADRVIETGVTNGLTWRKWSSGIAECWGRFNLTVSPYTTNEMPGIPYGYYYDFKLPFEFVSLPCRVANISTHGAPTVNITGGLADTNTVVRVYWASTLNYTSHTVNVQIYGNWK